MEQSEYKKSFEDEVDWVIIDQLHSATSRFSTASIELKKMFIILIGISIPAIIKLTDSKIDASLFVTIYVLTFTFWYLDGFTYFYQENLRAKMDERFEKLKRKNTISETEDENSETDEYTLPDDRKKSDRWSRAFLNSSVRIYQIFFILNTIAFVLFIKGIVG
ncbi:hypothetical protein BTO04_00690 [Polaribacter sp. SA4-10]|uniref:hypothetical protein n=1 Tax=Polaribacter sp. SA4-10 TaxID=754397 RepID=UPI000B3C699C|nr:hypothetical protein [Polaribacter sp. SA4-10]ARV05298.1 hypothetical protein BTO04_00690 [Polaribacter sp. SA4-10]